MAELTICVRRNESTGQLELRVALCSDEDALPQEHEQLHRSLLAQLLPALDLNAGSDGGVEVTRERPAVEPVVG